MLGTISIFNFLKKNTVKILARNYAALFLSVAVLFITGFSTFDTWLIFNKGSTLGCGRKNTNMPRSQNTPRSHIYVERSDTSKHTY